MHLQVMKTNHALKEKQAVCILLHSPVSESITPSLTTASLDASYPSPRKGDHRVLGLQHFRPAFAARRGRYCADASHFKAVWTSLYLDYLGATRLDDPSLCFITQVTHARFHRASFVFSSARMSKLTSLPKKQNPQL